MTQKEKRLFTVFCTILLILACCILLRYYKRLNQWKIENSPTQSEIAEAMTGKELPTGYRCTTTDSQFTQNENDNTITSRRTFTHRIYTPESNYLAAITITITGSISTDECTISHLSSVLSDEQREDLTISEHISGETATVVLYKNQISVGHFQYRLSPDGTIDYL